jgi:hypothetical protein
MINKKNSTMPIDCKKCGYFFITWDKVRPYGCKALNFKTKKIPSQEVLNASGMECLKFAAKKEPVKSNS